MILSVGAGLIDDFIGIVLSLPFCLLPFCPRTHPGVCMYGNYAKKISLLLVMPFSTITDVFLLKLHIIAFRSISIRHVLFLVILLSNMFVYLQLPNFSD